MPVLEQLNSNETTQPSVKYEQQSSKIQSEPVNFFKSNYNGAFRWRCHLTKVLNIKSVV